MCWCFVGLGLFDWEVEERFVILSSGKYFECIFVGVNLLGRYYVGMLFVFG